MQYQGYENKYTVVALKYIRSLAVPSKNVVTCIDSDPQNARTSFSTVYILNSPPFSTQKTDFVSPHNPGAETKPQKGAQLCCGNFFAICVEKFPDHKYQTAR